MLRTSPRGGEMSTLQAAFVPDERTIFDWIETVFARGVRRLGMRYAADE